MRLFDRLGVGQLMSDDVEPAAFYDEAEAILYCAEIRRDSCDACVTVEIRQSIDDREGEILTLRAAPYLADFRPVSFRLFGWHYRPDDNAVSFVRAAFSAIRDARALDIQGLSSQYKLTKSMARISLIFSRDELPV